MTERNGVEIDYCPQCRGVWLDRGELDKIIERAGAATQAPMQGYPQQQPQQYGGGHHGGGGKHGGQQGYTKRRGNWLGELFD